MSRLVKYLGFKELEPVRDLEPVDVREHDDGRTFILYKETTLETLGPLIRPTSRYFEVELR